MVMCSISVGEPGRFVRRSMGTTKMRGRELRLESEELLVSPQEMEFIAEKHRAHPHHVDFQHYIITYIERRLELSRGLERRSDIKEPLVDGMVEAISAFVAKDASETHQPSKMLEAATGGDPYKVAQGMVQLFYERHTDDPAEGKDANSGLFTSKEFFHRSEKNESRPHCCKEKSVYVRLVERGFMTNEALQNHTNDFRKHLDEGGMDHVNLLIRVVSTFLIA